MKATLILLSFCCIHFFLQAQCPEPTIASWSATLPQDVSVEFNSETTGNYELMVFGKYMRGNNPLPDTLWFDGVVNEGLNILHLDVSGMINVPFDQLEWSLYYYYHARLWVFCDEGTSNPIDFYFSPHSLRNDPGLNFSSIFQEPLLPIPDAPEDESLIIPVEVPETFADPIASLEVFIDMAHTYNGDMKIELTSPEGTTRTLLNFGNGLGGSRGFSTIYSDASDAEIDHNGTIGPKGLFMPYEALSAFNDEDPTGTWLLSFTDNLNQDTGFVYSCGLRINESYFNSAISGQAYYDFNGNNLKDPNEPAYGSATIYNSIDNELLSTNTQGFYSDLSAAGVGFLEISNPPLYYTTSTIDLNLPQGTVLENQDIALIPTPNQNDLVIDLVPLSAFIAGDSALYVCTVQNAGTTCQEAVQFEFIIDANLIFGEIDTEEYIVDGNEISLEIEELCPTETVQFAIRVFVDSELQEGSVLVSEAQVIGNPDELTPANNLTSVVHSTSESFQPITKEVSESIIDLDFVENDSSLVYTIRFQNINSGPSFNVEILDTLDADLLDLETVNIISSSHGVVYEQFYDIFRFYLFGNLLFPSTNDFLGSMGYLKFEIALNENAGVGDIVENTAQIDMGFNIPFITNTVYTEIVEGGEPSGIQINTNSSLCGNAYELNVFEMGTDNVVYQTEGNLADDLIIELPNSLSGTFDMVLNLDNFLGTGIENVDLAPGPPIGLFITLVGGDLNDDNTVNIQDFSIFSSQYGLSSDDPDFNNSSDLNCDGQVGIGDYSIFSSGFGSAGIEVPSEME